MLTTFIIICVLFVLIAIAAVAVPLWRGRSLDGASSADRRETVLAILRQQAAELERERASGAIDMDEYEETRQELEHRVLEETRAAADDAAQQKASSLGRIMAMVCAVLIPVVAVSGYLALGRYTAMDPEFLKMVQQDRTREGGHSQAEMEQAINKLQARLKENPEDLNTWYLLARTCASVNRFDDAYQALKELSKRMPDNADIIADMADMLSAANGKVITPEAEKLLHDALKLDPNQWKALALLAIHSWDKERYADAARYWERLLSVVPPDFPDREQIQSNINEAKRLSGAADSKASVSGKADSAFPPAGKPASGAADAAAAPSASSASDPVPTVQPAPAASVKGTVVLGEAFKDRVKPTDTIFIYARPVEGSKMPVAFLKISVADLPYNFDLRDNMMMATGKRHLSEEKSVIVGARLSPSGNFMSQPGDIEGELSTPVDVGAEGVRIVLDTVKR